MKVVLHVLQRADDVVGRRFNLLQHIHLPVCQNTRVRVLSGDSLLRERRHALTDLLHRFQHRRLYCGRDAEGKRHTRDCGMDTRVEHRIPKRQPDCQVEHLGAYALDISDYQQQQHDTGIQQICRIEMSGVASGDYYDSTKVVGNGESGEKHLQRQWHTFAENR